jgi:dienelactone hydrolase
MRSRLLAPAAVLLLVTGLLAACTGRSSTPTRTSPGCRDGCSGTIAGAAYSIKVPANWNGTLLVYSHGYQHAATHPFLSQADGDGDGTDAVSRALLAKGYALAGSAYPSGGWVVAQAVDAADRLHTRFTTLVRTPTRVIAWGASMGGLVTELLAERASWVDGATAYCGVTAGPTANADNLARGLVLAQALLGVTVLRADGSVVDDVSAAAEQVVQRVGALTLHPTGAGAAALYALAALLGLPDRSTAYPGNDLGSRVLAAAHNVEGYLQFALQLLPQLADEYGDAPAQPDTAGLTVRFTAAQQADFTALGGSLATLRANLNQVVDPRTTGASRTALAASGTPTGRLRVPVLALHTEDDPIAIAANETRIRATVAAAGESGRLVQAWIAPASAGTDPAYGVGHCAFSAAQQVAAVVATDTWVRTGTAPTTTTLRADLGAGYDPSFVSPAWPG